MEKRSAYTIKTLLEEMKTELPKFKKGMVFETLQTFFPKSNVPKENRNVFFREQSFTKPLACSRKDKENYIKEDSPVSYFFKETTRGDFLEIKEVKNGIALCENLSLKNDIREEFYKNELIEIKYNDLVNGLVRIYRRKIDKFF